MRQGTADRVWMGGWDAIPTGRTGEIPLPPVYTIMLPTYLPTCSPSAVQPAQVPGKSGIVDVRVGKQPNLDV